jgi:hypothetical protein
MFEILPQEALPNAQSLMFTVNIEVEVTRNDARSREIQASSWSL